MNSPFLDQLWKRLDAVAPGVHDRLEELDRLSEAVGEQAVRILLQQACQSQHVGNIQAAKDAIARIPEPWLLTMLEKTIDESLDLGDEWEYRRLLEVLRDNVPELLSIYIGRGLSSKDLEIREAANEFAATRI
jgi:hypothetical protein